MSVALAALVSLGFAGAVCPPEGFETQGALSGGFDIQWYANGTWYIQQQMPIIYLPKNYTYCVSATYSLLPKQSLLGYDINVRPNARVSFFWPACVHPRLAGAQPR
jgi:hypothetical protein